MRSALLGSSLMAVLLLASCTLIHAYPPTDPPFNRLVSGDIGYQVQIPGDSSVPRLRERNRLFVEAVGQALRDSGYQKPILLTEGSTTVSGSPKLKLSVAVTPLGIFYDYGHAAAPQEWLTGFSLGLIPSWATRHELQISFELVEGEALIRKWDYMPKTLWINHLLFAPLSIGKGDISSDYKRQAGQLAAATRYFMGSQ